MDTSTPVQKKDKTKDTANETDNKTIFSKEHFLNFPIPVSDGKACIVKVI